MQATYIHPRRQTTWLALVVLALSCLVPGAHAVAEWTTLSERWYAMELAGSHAGYMHVLEERDGETFRTTTRTQISLARAGSSLTAVITSTFTEREDGTPVRLDYKQDMSAQAVESSMIFGDDTIVVTARQGDQATEETMPAFEEEWLTPRQIGARFEQALANGDRSLEFRTIDGSAGPRLIEVRQDKIGEEEMVIDGESQPVTVWKTKTSTLNRHATERYDAAGVMVSQEVMLGFGALKSRRCSQEEATRPAEGGAPELLVSTFVTPDKPIKRLQYVERLQMRLRLKDGERLELPSAGAQRVEPAEDRASVLVTIANNREGDAWKEEPPNELREFLEPSLMINSNDETVQKLAERAVRRTIDDPLEKAEAMRAFVHRHIMRKGLEVAFATAGETARRKQGDCSEHAVLLAALLRANGIPSRVVTGLVYADAFAGERDLFGWHMWTQAWINDRWIDLDATLQHAFHAGHIMTGASSLAEGIGDADFASLVLLMGQLEIEIVNVEYAQR